ncbi:hypothetical protein F6Y05_39290 [Bacillus megaterium]|nr:hypothetical protein [Priestia megaterium]
MKNVILLSTLLGFGLLLGTGHAQADSYVHSYTKKDGTFVKGYMKSDPDGIFSNNYSSYGNVNPYTGKKGTKNQPPIAITMPLITPLEFLVIAQLQKLLLGAKNT